MKWEELLKILQEQADEEGNMPDYMGDKAVVHIGDDLTEVRIAQSLTDGSLLLIPVFND